MKRSAREQSARAARELRRLGRDAVDLNESLRRVRNSLPAIVQITVAAITAYSVAHLVFGHQNPFLSVTVCITSLTLARDARPRRVLDTSLGITFGVLLANLSLVAIGRGFWQLAVVMTTVMLLARFVHRSPGFAVSAAVQASLVQLIPVADGREFTRPMDAVVGAITALLATAIVPRDAHRLARHDEHDLLDLLELGIDQAEEALRSGNHNRGEDALDTLRGTQPILENWYTSLQSAKAIAAVSPWYWRRRREVNGQEDIYQALDFAVRNARVTVRRISQLVGDGVPRPELAETMGDIESGVAELRASIDDREMVARARQTFTLAMARLDPSHGLLARLDLADATVLMQCRPLLVDLLMATGLSLDEARAKLPDAGEHGWQ